MPILFCLYTFYLCLNHTPFILCFALLEKLIVLVYIKACRLRYFTPLSGCILLFQLEGSMVMKYIETSAAPCTSRSM